MIHKAYVTLDFYCELPDDDLKADSAFDAICYNVCRAASDADIADVDPSGFSVRDADAMQEN